MICSLLFKEGAVNITAILRPNDLISEMEVFLSHGTVGGMIGGMRNIGVSKRRDGSNPAWLVITPMRYDCQSRLGADK